MADPVPSSMALWPRLRRRARGRKGGKSKPNPYASQGLEKFAVVFAELEARRTSVAEKTGTSISVVRFLSSPARGRTASGFAPTVGKVKTSDQELAPVVLKVQLPASNVSLASASSSKVEKILLGSESAAAAELFQVRKTGCDVKIQNDELMEGKLGIEGGGKATSFDSAIFKVDSGDLKVITEESRSDDVRMKSDCVFFDKDLLASADLSREGSEETVDSQPGTSNRIQRPELPVKAVRTSRRRRGLAMCVRDKGWKHASKSAVALLVSLGAFFVGKMAEFGGSVTAALTFGVVIRRWRRGSFYAKRLFSAIAKYLLDPLHSYLAVLSTMRLTLGSGLPKTEGEGRIELVSGSVASIGKSEIEIVRHHNSDFVFPVLTFESSPPSPVMPTPSLQEAMASSPASENGSPPPASPRMEVPSYTIDSSSSSPTHGGSKLSLKFKSKFLKSFPPKAVREEPPFSAPASPLSQDGDRYFSRASAASEHCESDTASSAPTPSGRGSSAKQHKSFRRRKSDTSPTLEGGKSLARTREGPQSRPGGALGKSGLSRVRTSTSQPENTISVRQSALTNVRTSSVEERKEVKRGKADETWAAVCLLVALLFLLVGRIPAILATSFAFLILSQIYRFRTGRWSVQQKEASRRAIEASRKLRRSSTPGSPRSPTSPLSLLSAGEGDIFSMEYRKRIIMEGLLERGRKSTC